MKEVLIPLKEKWLLRPEEVGALLGISRARAYQMIRSGALPSVRLAGGRLVRVPRASLETLINAGVKEAVA